MSDLHHAKTIPPDGEEPMPLDAVAAYSLARLRGAFVPTSADMADAKKLRAFLRLMGCDVHHGAAA